MADGKDFTLEILKEFASQQWDRTLCYSEIVPTPEVNAVKRCVVTIRSPLKMTSSLPKYEFMWTFSTDDSDFIEIVYTPNVQESGTHNIIVNTPQEEGWGMVTPGPYANNISESSLTLHLKTKQEANNLPYEQRTLCFKLSNVVNKKQKSISVFIIEMSSTGKSYVKTGEMVSVSSSSESQSVIE
ncbi:hypothetical protein EIN_185800 [Entamoeba invadens IP1]|uniref:hypothetical protein n=1 Tax=Entamoeba invadens IP1 TaxID=370355 RepID=UPI0002C3EAC1|nr:hypothetical protein EIN_185800 [Entamoeba invadens IP1]ELP94173.1 hypothetical protein EIN_185800 [Entamoeba invadens IP1]|eukprot:XP_004260944.1 hypothetical protein EIN_185800 [Entamoeba invadens IP1]